MQISIGLMKIGVWLWNCEPACVSYRTSRKGIQSKKIRSNLKFVFESVRNFVQCKPIKNKSKLRSRIQFTTDLHRTRFKTFFGFVQNRFRNSSDIWRVLRDFCIAINFPYLILSIYFNSTLFQLDKGEPFPPTTLPICFLIYFLSHPSLNLAWNLRTCEFRLWTKSYKTVSQCVFSVNVYTFVCWKYQVMQIN